MYGRSDISLWKVLRFDFGNHHWNAPTFLIPIIHSNSVSSDYIVCHVLTALSSFSHAY